MSQTESSPILVSADEAREVQSDPLASFIDVRGQEEYDASHIVGAINVPFDQLEDNLELLSKERPVIVYCNMEHRGESRSERAARMLQERGYNARALSGGIKAWEDAGYNVAQSP